MISNTTLTYDQQVRIAIRKQEAYIKREISLEAETTKKQMEVNRHHQQLIPDADHIKPTISNNKLTNEQRARIERNRMLALEKKKRLLHEQEPIKSQICTANQCTSNQCILITTTNNTPLCGNINTVTPPMKRQKTEQLSNETPLNLEIKPTISNDKLTDEQRARIERNRMMALERKRLIREQQLQQQQQQQQHPTMEETTTTNNDIPNKSFAENNIPRSSNSRGHLNNCQQCNQPYSKHRAYSFGRRKKVPMCKLSGQYQCRCGRKWWGQAFRNFHGGEFPTYAFPDCLKCHKNDTVRLLQHKVNEPTTVPRSNRGHQAHACQLCKRGEYCPCRH